VETTTRGRHRVWFGSRAWRAGREPWVCTRGLNLAFGLCLVHCRRAIIQTGVELDASQCDQLLAGAPCRCKTAERLTPAPTRRARAFCRGVRVGWLACPTAFTGPGCAGGRKSARC
jgi:hypothetical protein